MTQQISNNIKVPDYVNLLKADFSTSTPTHVIASEITTMASLQEYFEFCMQLGCGIPIIHMEGNEEDWVRIKEKFLKLKDLLSPIHTEIALEEKWWNDVENICDKLLETYNGTPDTDWWDHIFTFKGGRGSGLGDPFDRYDGWFISQLLGLGCITSLTKLNNEVVTVPMTITDPETGSSEDSAFAAGIAGFEMVKEGDE